MKLKVNWKELARQLWAAIRINLNSPGLQDAALFAWYNARREEDWT